MVRGLWMALAMTPLLAAAVAAEPAPALERCWSSPELGARSSERYPVRRRVALDSAALRATALAPAQPTDARLRGAIRRVKLPPGRKLIALTFDLCETAGNVAGYDGTIIDYLREHKVRATFFAGGKWLETHGERAQQLTADPLFELGNHGLLHRDFRHLQGKALSEELLLAQAAYERARAKLAARACLAPRPEDALANVPPRMRLFRFPFGTCDAKALQAVAEAGLLAIQWDVVSGDPDRNRSARAIAAGVIARVRPGSIIVAHANGRGWHTGDALPLIVPALRAQGYRFVTVGELLAAGEPVIAETCYQQRPGDGPQFNTAHRLKRGPTKKPRSDWHPFPAIAD